MPDRKSVLLLLFFLLPIPIITAAQSPSVRRDPEAVALLSKSVQTLTNGAPIRDVTLTGTVRRIAGSDQENGELTAEALATGEMRVDYNYASGARSESRALLPKGAAENWSDPDGSVHAAVPHNIAPVSPWFFPGVLLQTAASGIDIGVEYVGKETKSGHLVEHVTIAKQVPAYHHPLIMLTMLQKAARVELYLDAATGLPFAIAYNTHADKNLARDIPVEIRFSEYRPVQGIQAPTEIRKYLNRALVLDVKVNTTIINTGLSPSSLGLQ